MFKNSARLLFLFSLILGASAVSAAGAPKEAAVSRALERAFAGAVPAEAPSGGELRVFELTAAPAEWGIRVPYRTEVWAYNGQVPGPVLRVRLGDTVRVTLKNRLPQPTTVHWHGVRVPNAMDGVPGVTQPPVPPGNTFVYEFTPKDAGTFWFHPHVRSAEQIERGLNGVLVVEDPAEPAYQQDLVMVLDDWLLGSDGKISDRFVTRHDLAHDGRWGNVPTVNGFYRPDISVKPGERIRLRLVNAANGRVFVPALAEVAPTVIAVDGLPVERPFPLPRFPLAPGNRIDLDITIPPAAGGKHFALADTFSDEPFPLAFLQVSEGPAVATPTFEAPRAARSPDWGAALKAPVAHEFRLNAERGGDYGIAWTIDGRAWPDGASEHLEIGRFHRLRFTNDSYRLHPMHLHGQFFRVIARNGEPAMEPFWRDTVLIGPKESVDVGLVPLDAGTWTTHCHILEHAEAGMMGVVHVE